MGDAPVGDRDEDATRSKNVTLKERTYRALAEAYPHALDDPERIRMAIHDALEDDRDADETE